jgi:OMF family outer membrane factor
MLLNKKNHSLTVLCAICLLLQLTPAAKGEAGAKNRVKEYFISSDKAKTATTIDVKEEPASEYFVVATPLMGATETQLKEYTIQTETSPLEIIPDPPEGPATVNVETIKKESFVDTQKPKIQPVKIIKPEHDVKPIREQVIDTSKAEAAPPKTIKPEHDVKPIREKVIDTSKAEAAPSKIIKPEHDVKPIREQVIDTTEAGRLKISPPPERPLRTASITNDKKQEGSYYDNLDKEYTVSTTEDKLKVESVRIPENIEEPITLKDVDLGINNVQRINLASSIEFAINQNLDLLITSARSSQEKWKYFSAFGRMLPDVNLSYSYARYKGTVLVGGIVPVDVERTSIIPALIADVEAFKGFENLLGGLSAHHQYKASVKELQTTIDNTIYDVTEAYYNLLRNKAKVMIAEKAVEQAKEQLRINQGRLDAGVGTRFDVLQSKTLLSESEQQLIQDKNTMRLSMVFFANLIGVNLFSLYLPEEDTVDKLNLLDHSLSLDDMIDIALLNRSEIGRDKEFISALVMQKRSALSNYLPHASVSGGLQGSGDKISNVRRSQFISINLSWQGLTDLGTTGILKTREIGYQIKEARLKLEKTLRTIQQEVMSSYYTLEAANKVIEQAEVELKSASEGLRLAEIRLKAGVGTNTDLVDAQVTFTQARVKWVNAVIEYNLSEVRLLKDMGVINIEHLMKGVTKEELLSLHNQK